MRAMCRSIAVRFLVTVGALALGTVAMVAPGGVLATSLAATTALVLGGTGTPTPSAEPGYMENVTDYYIRRYSSCQATSTPACSPESFTTPETAWPLYGGLSALTWQDSVLEGSRLLDTAVRTSDAPGEGDTLVLFGYSQSGAILALQKRKMLADPDSYGGDLSRYEFVVIGNVSRPNGGLNSRLPITVPIVEFPFGPPMTPVESGPGIRTTDIAMKWDIIADAPLYVTNPLAMANALLGGPGFGIVHGTYPNPEGNPPSGLIGGYTQDEWETILANPELNDHLVDTEIVGDTTYYTITPKVLPLVQPLHQIGLTPVADLIEPALRVIIEQTGYDRDLSYGTPTTFRLVPVFNPVKLATDLVPAVTEGVDQFVKDLQGQEKPSPVKYPEPVITATERSVAADPAPATTPVVTTADTGQSGDTDKPEPAGIKAPKKPSQLAGKLRKGLESISKLGRAPKLRRAGDEAPDKDEKSTTSGEGDKESSEGRQSSSKPGSAGGQESDAAGAKDTKAAA